MKVAMVFITDLDMTAGGIETWVQYFVPALLTADPDLELTIVCRDGGDATDRALASLESQPGVSDRLTVERVALEGSGWPQSPRTIPFVRGFTGAVRRMALAGTSPDVWLSVGGVQVASAMHMSRQQRRRFHQGADVHWARSVFTREVGHRVGSVGRSVLLRLEKHLYGAYDGFIANGWDTAEFYSGLGLHPHVIPNAVDVNRWRELDETAWGETTRVVWTDRLARVKGIEAFLEACRLCEPSIRAGDLEFHVFGDGPFAPEVQASADRDLLHFHGKVPNADVPRLTAGMQVACSLTYLEESQGTGGVPHTLLEQLAAGRVVVGWRNAHLGQALDETNGVVLPQGDHGALAQTFRDISGTPERFAHLRQSARATAERFSVERHVEAALAYLRHVVDSRTVGDLQDAVSTADMQGA